MRIVLVALLFACAATALAAIRSAPPLPSSGVTYIPAATVAAAFAKGQPLVETPQYKVQGGRRDAAGEVEVHARDTDIFYVLEGRATVVTGGSVANARTIAPNEQRGASIEGGDTHELGSGDVLVVPAGVPHWFRAVPGPIRYFVVKVSAGDGGAR
jgi:quercetin dioxygenase-like cupin family protein